MPMRILYEAGIQATSEDITNRVRLYTLDLAQNAEEGSVALSGMTIDDPDGDYDVVGWRRVRVAETTATGSNALIYNGWVAEREVSRGPFVVGAARVWECSLADMNSIISMRVLNGTDANRPAETDVARINWLMGTNEMSRVTETEYISSASPKNMDAVDYRGQTLIDVINDCAQQSGKNFFVYTKDHGAGNSLTLGLWYDFASSTSYSSPLRLSNVLSDIDGSWTFEIAKDTTLTRDPSRTYSGAYVRYDGGAVYEENITTSNVYTRRDAVYDASNVKNSTTATNRALRYLTTTDVEEDRIKTAFYVPAAKVNFVREGMRIQFKALHLPGYEVFNWLRVLKRQVKEVTEIDESTGRKYLVSLELGQNDPPQTVIPPVAQGAGVMYGYADNAAGVSGPVEVYVNGHQIVGPFDDNLVPAVVASGYMVSGDNVVAAKISNGTGSEYWWGGNGTGWEMRLYNDAGSPVAWTDSTARVLPLQNFHLGTLNAEPGGWKDASFDDSAWASAEDVTGSLNSLAAPIFPTPISPSRTVAPPGAKVEAFTDPSYAYLLIWLVRVNFTI